MIRLIFLFENTISFENSSSGKIVEDTGYRLKWKSILRKNRKIGRCPHF